MDEQQHNALELPKGLYEPVLRQPMELDFLLGQELSLCFHDLDGSHVFKTCYGDICKQSMPYGTMHGCWRWPVSNGT